MVICNHCCVGVAMMLLADLARRAGRLWCNCA